MGFDSLTGTRRRAQESGEFSVAKMKKIWSDPEKRKQFLESLRLGDVSRTGTLPIRSLPKAPPIKDQLERADKYAERLLQKPAPTSKHNWIRSAVNVSTV